MHFRKEAVKLIQEMIANSPTERPTAAKVARSKIFEQPKEYKPRFPRLLALGKFLRWSFIFLFAVIACAKLNNIYKRRNQLTLPVYGQPADCVPYWANFHKYADRSRRRSDREMAVVSCAPLPRHWRMERFFTPGNELTLLEGWRDESVKHSILAIALLDKLANFSEDAVEADRILERRFEHMIRLHEDGRANMSREAIGRHHLRMAITAACRFNYTHPDTLRLLRNAAGKLQYPYQRRSELAPLICTFSENKHKLIGSPELYKRLEEELAVTEEALEDLKTCRFTCWPDNNVIKRIFGAQLAARIESRIPWLTDVKIIHAFANAPHIDRSG